MTSPDIALVVIACPHCRTRYQVPPATLGPDGRDVQCAHCGKSWFAPLPPPSPVAPPAGRDLVPSRTQPAPFPEALLDADEDELDWVFEEAARQAKGALGQPDQDIEAFGTDLVAEKTLDPDLLHKSHKDFVRRQAIVNKGLPTAKIRRTARLAGLLCLGAILFIGLSQREAVVRGFPSLAAIYAAIGIPVNIVGLAFEDPRTVMTVRSGNAVLQVTATIRSVAATTVPVPPVLVTLLDRSGIAVYEWTVLPQAGEMEPGERLALATEVNAPPGGAARVRLSFTTSSGLPASPKVS